MLFFFQSSVLSLPAFFPGCQLNIMKRDAPWPDLPQKFFFFSPPLQSVVLSKSTHQLPLVFPIFHPTTVYPFLVSKAPHIVSPLPPVSRLDHKRLHNLLFNLLDDQTLCDAPDILPFPLEFPPIPVDSADRSTTVFSVFFLLPLQRNLLPLSFSHPDPPPHLPLLRFLFFFSPAPPLAYEKSEALFLFSTIFFAVFVDRPRDL